jgi:hypothetical protein
VAPMMTILLVHMACLALVLELADKAPLMTE